MKKSPIRILVYHTLLCFSFVFFAHGAAETGENTSWKLSMKPECNSDSLLTLRTITRHSSDTQARILFVDSELPATDSISSVEQPSAPPPPANEPRLLPPHLSVGETFLWGTDGFLRQIGITGQLSVPERRHELVVRRTMLTAHQIGGFLTLGSMIATAYYGQRVLDGHRRDGDIHSTLAMATILSYSATGLLAILSPPPLIRRDEEESTITLHKTLAWIHFTGMVVTPFIAQYIGGRRHLNISRAHIHQVSGYITTAAFAAAMIVVTF